MNTLFTPLVAFLLLGGLPAQTTAPDETEPLETVEIRGRRPEDLEATVDRTVAEVTRVEILEQGAFNVLDAVRTASPSVFVTRRSVMGYGLSSGAGGLVTVRGIGGQPNTGLLTTVDGVPSRMGLFGHPLQDIYTPEMFDRVEVMTGPASDLFGGSALGGAINLVSRRRWEEGVETEIGLRHARYDTWETTVAHGGRRDRWDWYATGGWRQTHGHEENSSFRQHNLTLQGGYEFAPGYTLRAHLRAARFRVEDPFQAASDLVQRVTRRGATVLLEEKGDDAEGRAAVYYEWGVHGFSNGWDSEDRTLGVSLRRAMTVAEGLRVAGGFDWCRYGGEAQLANGTVDLGEHTLTETSGFLRGAWQAGEQVRVAGGLKLLTHTTEDLAVLPSFSLLWERPDHPWGPAVRLGATRGFRAPTVNELHFPLPANNRNLDPERVDSVELSGRLQRGPWRGEVTLFALRGEDAIVRQGPPPPFSIANGGTFRHRGVEGSTAWTAGRWGARLGAAYLHHEGISPGAFRWRLLYGAWFGSDPAAGPGERWRLTLHGETVHDLWGNVGTASHKEDFTTLSLTGSWDLADGVHLTAGVENLGDARWHEVGNLEVPGRTPWAGVRVVF